VIQMKWNIKRIINFSEDKRWENGYCHFGFHDDEGNQYRLDNDNDWIGLLEKNDEFRWTAGCIDPELSKNHISCEIRRPTYLARYHNENSLIVTSHGTNKIIKLYPKEQRAEILIDGNKEGIKNIGNCEFDIYKNIWINEITGCRIWMFNSQGRKKLVLGDGIPGFQKNTTQFETARFNWIYDLRKGFDGNIYVLDSKNYSIRKINPKTKTVETIIGIGSPGYTGDGEQAKKATLGGKENQEFDGPWSLSLDEFGNTYIGDTQNHVVRMVERHTGIISTIAGNPEIKEKWRNSITETNPLRLNLPRICSMEYHQGNLYIPDWDGDLIILSKCTEKNFNTMSK